MVLPEKDYRGSSVTNSRKERITHSASFGDGIFQTIQFLEFNIPKSFWLVISIFDDFYCFCLCGKAGGEEERVEKGEERWTFSEPKKSSRSMSVRSKAKLPTKAVKGGSDGKGRSSRGGRFGLSAV